MNFHRPVILALCLSTWLVAQQPLALPAERVAKLYDLNEFDLPSVAQPVQPPRPAAPSRPIDAPSANSTDPQLTPNEAATKPKVTNLDTATAAARLARAFIHPPLRNGDLVEAVGGRWIAVVGSPQHHAWVTQFLATARDAASHTNRIEFGVYSLPEMAFQRDVKKMLGVHGATSGESHRLLAPGPGTTAFLQALRERDDVNFLATPTVALRQLVPASIETWNETAYVKDFDVEIATNAVIANPVIDVVRDGISIQTAAVDLTHDRLRVSVDANVSDLQRPIPTFETTIGTATEPVTIQLPSVAVSRIAATAELRRDDTMVLMLPTMAVTRYLVTVRILP